MATENIDLRHLSGSTATLAAITTKNDRWLYDTTKDHAVAYKTDGSTLRHFLMADSSNNLINTMGNMIIGDGKYFGLAADKGRLQFDDEGTDTITVKSASLLLGGILGSDGDADTYLTMGTADKISFLAGGVTFLDMVEDTQDLFEVNPNQADIDFTVNTSGLEALAINGATGAAVFGSTVQALRLGIGGAAHATEELYVTGTSTITGLLTLGAGATVTGDIDSQKTTGGKVILTRVDDTITSANDLGGIYFMGTDGGTQQGVLLLAEAEGDWDTGDCPSMFSIYTTPDGSASGVNRFVIHNDGVVCITSKNLVLGASTPVNGDWQWIESGGNLLCQKMESSSWVTKATVIA